MVGFFVSGMSRPMKTERERERKSCVMNERMGGWTVDSWASLHVLKAQLQKIQLAKGKANGLSRCIQRNDRYLYIGPSY